MKSVIFSIMPLVLILNGNSSAIVINIPADYPTIQQGIDASFNGDTVLVQPGTYVENINFNGHNITLGSLFLTLGDSSYVLETIIDGDSSGSVVTFDSGEDSTAVITGFTLRNGYASRGGGIYCTNSDPVIINNIIRHNIGDIHGGGIYCTLSRLLIISNIIVSNETHTYGAGIFCANGGPIIKNNTITGNIIDVFYGGSGGGIYCSGSEDLIIENNFIVGNRATTAGGIHCEGNATIKNNHIIGNSATVGFEWEGSGGGMVFAFSDALVCGNMIWMNSAFGYGGGICCFSSDIFFYNNIVSDNWAFPDAQNSIGGGIFCQESSPIILNNVINRNTAGISGGGIHCEFTSNPHIANTVFWADSASYNAELDCDDSSSPVLEFCDIQGGWPGEGNIDIDPLFRNEYMGDFHLMSVACGDPYDSPCIDSGDPDIDDILLDCSWGLGTILSDMGAYGGGDSTILDIDDYIDFIPERLALLQNYPNPFNASTAIKFDLPEATFIEVAIYDLLGRRVGTLYEGLQQSGEHSLIWNANDIPSGVYFARLKAGDTTQNIKMTLLR